MKKILTKLPLSLLLVLAAITGIKAQDNKQLRRERIQSSYMLALGRNPSEAEINYWQGRTDANTIADFVKNHKAYIGQDAGTRRAIIIKSYNDILGRNPSQGEIDYWAKYNSTYSELTKNHVQWLAGNPGEYENVIRRSYQFYLKRQPNADEIRYWKSQGTLSYLMLVACHEDWVKRGGNRAQTGSGAGLNANSVLVNKIQISPTIAREAKSFAGVVASGGGNIVASGAGNIVAAGAGNVVAAGAGNIVAAGAGN
jgi:hypothetical protein